MAVVIAGILLTLALQAPPGASAPPRASEPADGSPRAGAEGSAIVVESQGTGPDRASALRQALDGAILEAVGGIVESDVLVRKDELVKDEIRQRSGGIIQRYDQGLRTLVRESVKAPMELDTAWFGTRRLDLPDATIERAEEVRIRCAP